MPKNCEKTKQKTKKKQNDPSSLSVNINDNIILKFDWMGVMQLYRMFHSVLILTTL